MERLVDSRVIEELASLDDGAVMREVFGLFRRDSREMLDRLQPTTGETDLARLAHRLKGSSGTLGLHALSDACEELEGAIRERGDLVGAVERLHAVYEKTLDVLASRSVPL